MSACCTPSGDRPPRDTATDPAGNVTVEGVPEPGGVAPTVAPGRAAGGPPSAVPALDLTALPGGRFTMGTDAAYGYPADGEGPAHEVRLAPFAVGTTTVTNADFAAFVRATGHVTEAERYGWSFVFAAFLPDDHPQTKAVAAAPWWRQVEGAMWAHPEGPRSDVGDRDDHPVTHVSWDDAQAFCAWSGTRLPTEAEWEYAARGGRVQCRFPWGNDLRPDGTHLMNSFQGRFPEENTVADGFAGTAPVRSFPPNGFGLCEVTGNVWEWTADWFDPGYYRVSPRDDPRGPHGGTNRVMRGGSYLCHASYCNRYRVDSRSANSPDSSTGNLGFRVARDQPPGESLAERSTDPDHH